jgi:hypothetical protein
MTITKSLINSLAQQAATETLTSGVPLSSAIINVISGYPEITATIHTPVMINLVRRVVQSANKLVFLSLYAKSEDKTFKFDVADADTIIQTLLKEFGGKNEITVTHNPIREEDYTLTDDMSTALDAAENELIYHANKNWEIPNDLADQLGTLEQAMLEGKEDIVHNIIDPVSDVDKSEDPLEHYPVIIRRFIIKTPDNKIKPDMQSIADLVLSIRNAKQASAEKDMQAAEILDSVVMNLRELIKMGGDPEKIVDGIIMKTENSITPSVISQFLKEAALPIPTDILEQAKYNPDPRLLDKVASEFDAVLELTSMSKAAADAVDLESKVQIVKALTNEFPEVKTLVNSYLGGDL